MHTTNEEQRLNKRINTPKYQMRNHIDDANKTHIKGSTYVDVDGRLVELSEAKYLNKTIYNDMSIPRQIKLEGVYVDRMRQWDPKKFDECKAKLENKITSGRTVQGLKVKDIELFLTLYNGYPCRLSMITENTGYDGYDYTYLQWVKTSDFEKYTETSINNTNKGE